MRPSEGLWRPTMHSKSKVRKPSFAFAGLPIGKSTLPLSRPKCSAAGCFSTSSIGRKIRLHCLLRNEALRTHWQASSSHRRPCPSRPSPSPSCAQLCPKHHTKCPPKHHNTHF